MLHKTEAAIVSDNLAAAALFRLMAWLSPAYPIGTFSYSSGIEWAIDSGDIVDRKTLKRWLATILAMGGGFCDAVFLKHAHCAITTRDDDLLREVAGLAAAAAPSKERFLETTLQGQAFVATTRAAWPCRALDRMINICGETIALPVAVGVAAAGHEIPLSPTLCAYLQAFSANLVSAAVRLIPLGQTDGQRVIAALERDIAATVRRARTSTLDDIGSSAFRVDLSSMHHETQYTRLFRS